MNCSEVQAELVAYLEGKRGARAQSVAKHIEECGACAREYNGLRNTIKAIRQIELVDPGREFWEGQLRSIRGRCAEGVRSEAKRFLHNLGRRVTLLKRPAVPLISLPVCGAVALLLIAGMLYFSGRGGVSDLPVEADFSLDEKALGEAYLSGALFHDLSASDELDLLSDKELAVVSRSLARDDDVPPGWKEEEIIEYEENAYSIEGEIDNLDMDEFHELLNLLEKDSSRS